MSAKLQSVVHYELSNSLMALQLLNVLQSLKLVF